MFGLHTAIFKRISPKHKAANVYLYICNLQNWLHSLTY